MTHRRSLVALLACFATTQAHAATVAPKPGEGVVCIWMIYTALDQAGRRCFPSQDGAFQGAIRESVARIDKYVADNGITSAQIAAFKRQQGFLDKTDAEFCRGEMLSLYRNARDKGTAAKIRTGLDTLLARPGNPTFGDCL